MSRLSRYLDMYPAASTKNAKRTAMFSFMDYLYGSQRKGKKCTQEEAARYEDLIEDYFNDESRDHAQNLIGYIVWLKKNKTSHTTTGYISHVKDFLEENDMELTAREKKRIKQITPKSRNTTIERPLDHSTLRSIIQHLDVRGKALVLVLASSGIRISDALALTPEEMDLSKTPAELKIRGETEKEGNARIVFISQEAAIAVKEWLKVRDKWLDVAVRKTGGLSKKNPDDDRIFPFSDQTARLIWDGACKKSGIYQQDKGTGRNTTNIHQLRKFASSNMKVGRMPEAIVETLLGHSGYLNGTYNKFPHKQLQDAYLRAESHLIVMAPQEFVELKDQVQELNELYTLKLARIEEQNYRLSNEVTQLREIVETTNQIENLVKTIINTPEIFDAIIKEYSTRIQENQSKPF